MEFLAIGTWQLLIIVLVGLFVLILPILAILSVIKHEFPGNMKVIWVIVIIVLPIIGSLIYFAIGRSTRSK